VRIVQEDGQRRQLEALLLIMKAGVVNKASFSALMRIWRGVAHLKTFFSVEYFHNYVNAAG